MSTHAVPYHPEQYLCFTLTTKTWYESAIPLTQDCWVEGGSPANTSIMPWSISAIKHDYLDTTGELVARLDHSLPTRNLRTGIRVT